MMALFSIWQGEQSGICLKRGGGPPVFADGTLEDPDAVKMKEFQAASWNEACQIQCDHYGWGTYTPIDDWEEIGPDEA